MPASSGGVAAGDSDPAGAGVSPARGEGDAALHASAPTRVERDRRQVTRKRRFMGVLSFRRVVGVREDGDA
jgi:hypothetical protein